MKAAPREVRSWPSVLAALALGASAFRVSGPAMPSGVRWRAFWAAFTACSVPGPKTPSATHSKPALASAACSCRTLSPRSPRRRAAPLDISTPRVAVEAFRPCTGGGVKSTPCAPSRARRGLGRRGRCLSAADVRVRTSPQHNAGLSWFALFDRPLRSGGGSYESKRQIPRHRARRYPRRKAHQGGRGELARSSPGGRAEARRLARADRSPRLLPDLRRAGVLLEAVPGGQGEPGRTAGHQQPRSRPRRRPRRARIDAAGGRQVRRDLRLEVGRGLERELARHLLRRRQGGNG